MRKEEHKKIILRLMSEILYSRDLPLHIERLIHFSQFFDLMERAILGKVEEIFRKLFGASFYGSLFRPKLGF